MRKRRASEAEDSEEDSSAASRTATILSLACNILLLIAKLVVAIQSGSLAVIASSIDSVFDLISGVVLYYTAQKMEKQEPYAYPIGKSRMEPVGILIFAIVMGLLSLQILSEAVQTIATGSEEKNGIDINVLDMVLLGGVIVVKFGLWIYCRAIPTNVLTTLICTLLTLSWFRLRKRWPKITLTMC